MHIVLLSGGSGKRLWPLSNDIRSKQFIPLFPQVDGEYISMAQRVFRQIRKVDMSKLKPLKVVVNAGNGAAGQLLDVMEKYLPFELVKVHHQPDGNFPNGVPNPLLPDNREATAKAVREFGADAGVAWDGDFDRCYLVKQCCEYALGEMPQEDK